VLHSRSNLVLLYGVELDVISRSQPIEEVSDPIFNTLEILVSHVSAEVDREEDNSGHNWLDLKVFDIVKLLGKPFAQRFDLLRLF